MSRRPLPVDYAPGLQSPFAREVDQRRERDAHARSEMRVRRMRSVVDAARERADVQMREEQAVRKYLELRARLLAQRIDRARERYQPNPWLGPDSVGYVPPTEHYLQQEVSGSADAARAEVRAATAELGVLKRRAELAEAEWQDRAQRLRQIR